VEIAKSFNDPLLFEFQLENYTKKRNEFCYAGDWSGTLDISTGVLKSCWVENEIGDMFLDPDKPIPFQAIGHCHSPYCINVGNCSLGPMPKLKCPSYYKMREGHYTDKMRHFLDSKLAQSNKEYNPIKKFWINHKNRRQN
jgi:hypothetical protein